MNRHRTMELRSLVAACAAALLLGGPYPARAASPEDCREFHDECTDARAAGYHDNGICNVERLECSAMDDARVPKTSREPQDEEIHDPERSRGEQSIGP